ncbi:hypothetical protein BaRGS_00020619, partial [Batillaria attramentaria]
TISQHTVDAFGRARKVVIPWEVSALWDDVTLPEGSTRRNKGLLGPQMTHQDKLMDEERQVSLTAGFGETLSETKSRVP